MWACIHAINGEVAISVIVLSLGAVVRARVFAIQDAITVRIQTFYAQSLARQAGKTRRTNTLSPLWLARACTPVLAWLCLAAIVKRAQ